MTTRTIPHTRRRVDFAPVLWAVVYGMAVVLIAGHVLFFVGALRP